MFNFNSFKNWISFFKNDSSEKNIELVSSSFEENPAQTTSKGFEGWIPIFQGGVQVDSQGNQHDGYELIEKAIETFDPAIHEPPIVIGHPKDNTPAYGWVESLKKGVHNGIGVLLAKFKQVNPNFEELIKNGSFKKRSASFYPNGQLRHVGFLGAMPPAVKGLPDVQFSEGSFLSFELSTDDSGGTTKRFSEQELQDQVEKARQEERHNAQTIFAEKEVKRQRETKRKQAESFVEDCMKSGKIPPAIANYGMVEFMEALQDMPVISFSEGERPINPFEWMKNFVEKMQGFDHLFGEIATKRSVGEMKSKEDELGKEIAQYANS